MCGWEQPKSVCRPLPAAASQVASYTHSSGGGRPSCLASKLRHAPNLSESEERSLLTDYHTHPDLKCRHEALAKLWLAYGKLVVSFARKYRQSAHDYDDLISSGFLGLLDAINSFDTTRAGVRLGTYAVFRIRHEVETYLRRNARAVCLPDTTSHRQLLRHRQRLFRDAERACRREGVSPRHSELCKRVAARVDLPVSEVEYTLQLLARSHVSLDDEDMFSPKLADLIADSHENAVVSAIDSAALKARISALMDEILGKSERRAFQARCLTDDDPAHLQSLAAELAISPERVYQLEASAKRKLAIALSHQGFLAGDIRSMIEQTKVRARRHSADWAAMQKETTE